MKVLYLFVAYFLGAMPFGYLVFRWSEKKDIRQFGSGATGATNVLRLKGWRYALPVALFDVLKAIVGVWLAVHLFSDKRLALGAGFFVVLGHCFPAFIRFRGGKGVSTAMGAYAVLDPLGFLICVFIFVGAIAWSRYVSLGSLLATLCFPGVALLLRKNIELALFGSAVFILIVIRHKENIRRLLRGEERKFGQRVGVQG